MGLPVRFSRLFVDGEPADEVLLTAGNRVRPLAIRGVGRDQTDVIATAYSGGSGTSIPGRPVDEAAGSVGRQSPDRAYPRRAGASAASVRRKPPRATARSGGSSRPPGTGAAHRLIGELVEQDRRGRSHPCRDGPLPQSAFRGQVVATHPVLGGRHQFRILPEHGPGAIARNARLRYSTGGCSTGAVPLDVEVRNLTCYEAAYGLGGAE